MAEKQFTGWERRRQTGLRVKVADKVARFMITTAGIGAIIAITLVCVFLVSVVVPLFLPGDIEESNVIELDRAAVEAAKPVHTALDEYNLIGYHLYDNGVLQVFRLDNGDVLREVQLFEDGMLPVSHAFTIEGGHVAFGFPDGRIQTGKIDFETSFLNIDEVGPEHVVLDRGEYETLDDGIVQLTPRGQFRWQHLVVDLEDPVPLESEAPVSIIDISVLSRGPVIATMTADGTLHINSIRRTRNLMTRETTVSLQGSALPLDLSAERGLPRHIKLEGRGDTVLLIWEDGYTQRYDTRDLNNPQFAESFDMIEAEGVRVNRVAFMIGKMTLVVGDSAGNISTWFRVRPQYDSVDETPTVDASRYVKALDFPGDGGEGAVTSFAASARTRMLAAGYEHGLVRLFYITSNRLLKEVQALEGDRPVNALAFTPRDDAMVAGSEAMVSRWALDIPHPQTNLHAIFGKVQYEGFAKPQHMWQSSSGTDAFEPKYGLMPLIFGTIKATFYTMIFAVPLALLAAVYTSEFLNAKVKARVKPTIEVMASLPSVVLGFLAALVIAPVVERAVPGILVSFFWLPFTLLFAACLWQLLPYKWYGIMKPYRLYAIVLVLPLAAYLAYASGPLVESWLFAGDLRAWLNWQWEPGAQEARQHLQDATGGWIILMLPLSAMVTLYFVLTWCNPWMRRHCAQMGGLTVALLNLGKFLLGTVITLLLAYALSSLLNLAGFDPRGSYIGPYAQRNALIVGFVMGFAVIPIIYTIAEDALSAVPDHLRSGSLGAGATPWQTAIRIVIPTAMSGLFSAVMVGFGRAVGETMIVLMAAGNTPIMDWNMFNGFRTLSANIAVELSEAVKDGTNYRLLFLAALTLFVMTFILNTIAEIVRQRFRKRAFEL